MIAKFKNLILGLLLLLLAIEVLIIFPSQLEHENEAEVRARVEEQNRQLREAQQNPGATPAKGGSSLAEQKMQGIHFVESQQGARDWELFAESAEGNQGASKWNLNQVKIYFYNNEKVEFTVTGDKGNIDSKSKDLSVVGNVITRSENGYEFKSPSIFYSSVKRQIESPEAISMKGPADKGGAGIRLTGQNMLVLVDQSKMLIRNKVKAEKQNKDGKTMLLSAQGAEFSGKTNEAKFKGAVEMTYDGMKLEGPAASLIYEKGQNLLSQISVSGGIKATDLDKSATSERVVLDLLNDQYTFKGKPRVLHKNDELTGDEIVFLEGGKKVRVDRVRARVESKEE